MSIKPQKDNEMLDNNGESELFGEPSVPAESAESAQETADAADIENEMNDSAVTGTAAADTDTVNDADTATDVDAENDVYAVSEDFDEILGSSEKPFSKKKRIIIISSVAAAILIAGGVLFGLISMWRNGDAAAPAFLDDSKLVDTGKIFDGVSVNGESFAGLTEKQAEKKLELIKNEMSPKIALTVTANDKSEILTESNFDYTFNTEDVLNSIKEYCDNIRKGKQKKLKSKKFELVKTLNEDSVDIAVENLSASMNITPINKTVTGVNGEYFYSEGRKGSEIDKADLRAKIIEFLNSGETNGEIAAKVNPIEPITVNAQDESGEVVLLSTFSTTSTNTANGNHNMALALKACDGSVIKPGQVWSFNGRTGNTNLTSLGYRSAKVISGGKYVEGIGGGICQASTTIYNAALYAGLDIAERHYHLWASAYAKAGFDATIDYPGLDLKLKNSSQYPVYMKCTMSGNKLTVSIFGHKPTDYDTIKLNSVTTERVEGNYFRVAATRTFYKNGAVVKTENLTPSKYSLKKASGSGSTPTQPTAPTQPDPTPSTPSTSSTPSTPSTPSAPDPTPSQPDSSDTSSTTPSESGESTETGAGE